MVMEELSIITSYIKYAKEEIEFVYLIKLRDSWGNADFVLFKKRKEKLGERKKEGKRT